jgi:hypothetical protein
MPLEMVRTLDAPRPWNPSAVRVDSTQLSRQPLPTLDRKVEDSAIIRCVQNRRVEAPLRLAHAAVRAQPVLGSVTITVPRSHGTPARTATVAMRALTTTRRPDREKDPPAWPLTWTLAEGWEPHPAPACEALHGL